MLNYPSKLTKFCWVLAFGQNTKSVVPSLIEMLALVSLHLQLFGPSYGIFTKTSRVGKNPEFRLVLFLDRIVDLNCSS